MPVPSARDFIFVTWEGGGHVTPMFWAAQRMAARGRRVIAVSDEASRAEADSFGLAFRPWRRAPNRLDKHPAHDPLRDWEATTPEQTVAILAERLMVGPAVEYATDLAELLAERPGAIVVCQELLLGAMMAAETAGSPLALLTSNTWPYPNLAGVPPFGPGLEPPGDATQAQFQDLIRAAATALYDRHLVALNAARARLDLPPLPSFLAQLDTADLVLLGTSRAFDFAPAALPPAFRYAGPQVRVPHWASEWTSPWEADDPRPLVLVCFSTFYQEHEAALERVIEALGALPVRGLVTLGPALDPARFEGGPENVVIVRSASHDALMPHVSAFVTHGGHGAVIRPLLNGVPLLCMPIGRDQPENAARVAARGAGLRLPPDAGADAIASAVRRLLDEPAFAAAAAKLGQAIADAAEQDGDVVVDALEALAGYAASPRVAAR